MEKATMRMLLSCGMILLMVGVSEWVGDKEIIFPEIAALVIGGWMTQRQPWKTNPLRTIGLMALSAVVGVCMVRYVPMPLLGKVLVAFAFTGVSLIVTHATLLPMISACILPILMGTESVVYPISVIVMVVIIVVVQYYLGKKEMRQVETFTPCVWNGKEEWVRWICLFVGIAILGSVAVYGKMTFLIAPPLLVLFAELSFPDSPARKGAKPIYGLICLGAWLGMCSRLLLVETLGLPITVATFAAVAIYFPIMKKSGKLFPPAGAILLLPMIIPVEKLWGYPVQVMVGGGILLLGALKIGDFLGKMEMKQK